MQKVISKTVYKSIHVKMYLQLFVSIICHYFMIYLQSSTNKSIFYIWSIRLNDWLIWKVNNRGNFWYPS